VTSIDAERSVCPLTSKTNEIMDWMNKHFLENRRITVCEVANVLGLCVRLEQFKKQSEHGCGCCQCVWPLYVVCAWISSWKQNYS
jgi:hypothetical protein